MILNKSETEALLKDSYHLIDDNTICFVLPPNLILDLTHCVDVARQIKPEVEHFYICTDNNLQRVRDNFQSWSQL
jgi:hypothetical protein